MIEREEVFEATNHPDTDLQIIEDGIVVEELQLKATESISYINSTLTENSDIFISSYFICNKCLTKINDIKVGLKIAI